ncbi:hypothetical protein [Actinorhabdospora filicis]|uniref:hypothetical protein n=1 Tax=Actinorhabdospora filicis TaxID=1785913 RepID=UPI002552E115|nr:hypothetical protein [Actinorhabdospora filicis]
MAEHQRNYPDPHQPSDGGSLWEPNTAGRRASEWPEPPASRHDAENHPAQAEQWQLGGGDHEQRSRQMPEPQVVDPELAALAGGDTRPAPERGPFPPTFEEPRRAAQHASPPLQAGPTEQLAGPPMPQMAPPPTVRQAPIDPPTQAYPSVPRMQDRRTEPVNRRPVPPAEVVEGVYRKKRPALALLVALVSAVAIIPALVLLARSLFADNLSVGGVVAGVLLVIGIPLVGAGLSPLLGAGPRVGGREMSALLRPPYVYLVTGLVLVVAAGLAAA